MDTSSPPHPLQELLTEENLLKLQRHTLSPPPTPPTSSSTSSRAPIPSPSERLRTAKRAVLEIMKRLRDLASNCHHEEHHRRRIHKILETDELRITSNKHIPYPRNKSETPDLQNPVYWETKKIYFEGIYRFYNELRDAKDWVYDIMRALERLGHQGGQALEEEKELYIAGQNLICYRGKREPEPDLEDPTYWKARLLDLRAKYTDIKRQTPPPPPLVKPEQAKEWVYNIIRALKNVGAEKIWALRNSNLYVAGENDVRFRDGGAEPDLDDPTYWMAQLQHLGKCYASKSRIREIWTLPVITLEQAKELVFNAMWALKLEPEGRRILEDNELYIAGWNDVQYRGHHRNLEDPAYWLDRLKYFNDKYHDISRWNLRRRDGQRRVYDEIQRLLWDHGRGGLRLLLDDELYFDIGTDAIRYRGDDGYDARYKGREPPDLENPAYWEKRLQDFKEKNEQARRQFPSTGTFTLTELDELDELDEIEQAKKAYMSQLTDGGCEMMNQMEGIKLWVDSLQCNDLQRPSSPASIPSSAPESISSCDDRNVRCLSQEPPLGESCLQDFRYWAAKRKTLNGESKDRSDCSASRSESPTPSPPRTQIAPNSSAQHLVHRWETASPPVPLKKGLKRKTCHLDVRASMTHQAESRASCQAYETAETNRGDTSKKLKT